MPPVWDIELKYQRLDGCKQSYADHSTSVWLFSRVPFLIMYNRKWLRGCSFLLSGLVSFCSIVRKDRTSTPRLDGVACHFDSLQENWMIKMARIKTTEDFYRKWGYRQTVQTKNPSNKDLKHLAEHAPFRFAESHLSRGMIPCSWKVEETVATRKLGVQKNISKQMQFRCGFTDSLMFCFVSPRRIRLETYFTGARSSVRIQIVMKDQDWTM